MNKKNKVLFFGPYPEPYTGQSISFKQVFEKFDSKKVLFNTTKYGNNKVLNSLYCLIYLPVVFLFCKFDRIYFTCTRSKLGFIKDLELLILARLFKIKVVNHLHGADLNNFYHNSNFLKSIIKWSYGNIDTNIILLPSMKDQFYEFESSKIEVVYNSYSSDFKKYTIDFSLKKRQIVFLSNLIYSKGIFVFLESIEVLLKTDKNLIVKIAGLPMSDEFMNSKKVEKEFNEISKKLGKLYPERFFYLGMVKGEKKEELFKESSIFILPTFYKTEAFPLTIIEAMYFGNAIITTNHNYLPDVVMPNNGFLIEKKSSKEIIEKVNYLFENIEELRKIQEFNKKESIMKYNPESFNTKIVQIIKKL